MRARRKNPGLKALNKKAQEKESHKLTSDAKPSGWVSMKEGLKNLKGFK